MAGPELFVITEFDCTYRPDHVKLTRIEHNFCVNSFDTVNLLQFQYSNLIKMNTFKPF